MSHLPPTASFLFIPIFLLLLSSPFFSVDGTPLSSSFACSSPPGHLCYALDESASIEPTDFADMIRQVVQATVWFGSSFSSTSYSAVSFSTTSTTLSTFTRDIVHFSGLLANHSQARGGTSLGAGLSGCMSIYSSHLADGMTTGMDGSMLIVLVTDGKDNAKPTGNQVATGLKRSEPNVTIATIGVGSHVNVDQLTGIASHQRLFLKTHAFHTLARSIVRIVHRACVARSRTNGDSTEGDDKDMDMATASEAPKGLDGDDDEGNEKEIEHSPVMTGEDLEDDKDDANADDDGTWIVPSLSPLPSVTANPNSWQQKRRNEHKKKNNNNTGEDGDNNQKTPVNKKKNRNGNGKQPQNQSQGQYQTKNSKKGRHCRHGHDMMPRRKPQMYVCSCPCNCNN